MELNISSISLSRDYVIQNNNQEYNQSVKKEIKSPSSSELAMNNQPATSVKVTIPSNIVGSTDFDSTARSQMEMAINSGNIQLAKSIVSEMLDRLKDIEKTQYGNSFNTTLIRTDKHINIII
jgi:hypothetical protein